MIYSTGSHTKFYHRFHVVWTTKYRYKVMRGEMRERIREIIIQTCQELGVHIEKGVLSTDHVHMFISVPPQIALSKVMMRIKGRSSYKIQPSFPSCANGTGASVFGLADFSQQPAEMSLTLSYFSILNYIQKGNLPASAGSRSVSVLRAVRSEVLSTTCASPRSNAP